VNGLDSYKNHHMEVIFLLIGVSLLVALGFLMAYFKAVHDGQFDDEVTPAMRILMDEEILTEEKPTSH
jgi:cbb3-type cytochrome oxidase maturation protein